MFRVSRALPRLTGRRGASVPAFASRPAPRFQVAALSTKRDNQADPPPPKQPIDYEAERERGRQKIKPRPSEVSTASSTSNALKTPTANQTGEPSLQAELRHDMGIVKDTFRMDQVPRESRILGLAGTLPYLATSISTVFLAWDLKQELPTGSSFFDSIFVSHDTARYLLEVIEPIQLGYGAVIISFLGAIHWGLEYAEKAPQLTRTRFRYGMGLAAPMIAWPTLMMPVPYALTAQFMAFVGLYFADAKATTRGWAPVWYSTYRFMLTAMVGAALMLSLVGRAKIGQGDTLTSEGLQSRLEQTGQADHHTNWEKLEAEEKERRRKEKRDAEAKAKATAKKETAQDSKGNEEKQSSEGNKEDDSAEKAKDSSKSTDGKGSDSKPQDDSGKNREDAK